MFCTEAHALLLVDVTQPPAPVGRHPQWLGASFKRRLTVVVLTGCCALLFMLVATCVALWWQRPIRLTWRSSALLSLRGLPARGASCQFGVGFSASSFQRLTVSNVQLKDLARDAIDLPDRACVPSC